jgi:transcriptional regulator with XRE-family HTH domain
VPWNQISAQNFGAALRRLREERGLSQESLAFQAGITKNQIQLIEAGRGSGRKGDTGHSNPRMATLVGIADVLGLPTSELLARADPQLRRDTQAQKKG